MNIIYYHQKAFSQLLMSPVTHGCLFYCIYSHPFRYSSTCFLSHFAIDSEQENWNIQRIQSGSASPPSIQSKYKMNLCGGGMAGVADHEVVFRFPDEEFGMTSRKKKSSASSTATGRRHSARPSLRRQNSSESRHSTKTARGKTASSQSGALTPSSAQTHNPRLDYERRNRSSRGMKSSSVLTRKLETGFNLVSKRLYICIYESGYVT